MCDVTTIAAAITPKTADHVGKLKMNIMIRIIIKVIIILNERECGWNRPKKYFMLDASKKKKKRWFGFRPKKYHKTMY